MQIQTLVQSPQQREQISWLEPPKKNANQKFRDYAFWHSRSRFLFLLLWIFILFELFTLHLTGDLQRQLNRAGNVFSYFHILLHFALERDTSYKVGKESPTVRVQEYFLFFLPFGSSIFQTITKQTEKNDNFQPLRGSEAFHAQLNSRSRPSIRIRIRIRIRNNININFRGQPLQPQLPTLPLAYNNSTINLICFVHCVVCGALVIFS